MRSVRLDRTPTTGETAMPDWRSTPDGGSDAAPKERPEEGAFGEAPSSAGRSGSAEESAGPAEPIDGPLGHGLGAGGDVGAVQGGGQEGSASSGGSYGQGAYGDSARRSAARTTQYDASDRERPMPPPDDGAED